MLDRDGGRFLRDHHIHPAQQISFAFERTRERKNDDVTHAFEAFTFKMIGHGKQNNREILLRETLH